VSGWVWLGVAALGAVGAVARFLVDSVVGARVSAGFPAGTLVVNLSGALLLGLLSGLALTGNALVLAGTATIGSFTTFSTWMLESHRLVEDGALRLAGVNIGASIALGLGAAELGHWIGGRL
jgi:fluoride exporter